MPRDTNGNTQPLPGTIVSNGDTIQPSQHNPALVDLYAMMTQSLSRDGQGGMRAILDMSGFVVRNVGEATLDSDAVSLAQSRANGVPVGASMDYAGSTAPPTWMFEYGQAISRVIYADLFDVIGTTYGTGNGTTTFNLPDCRGRVVAGKDNMGGTSANRLTTPLNGDVLGGVGGAEGQTLSVAQLPPHNHGGNTGNAGAHDHAISVRSDLSGGGSSSAYALSGSASATGVNAAPNHNHSIASQGGGDAHPNVQPTIIKNKIIKVSY